MSRQGGQRGQRGRGRRGREEQEAMLAAEETGRDPAVLAAAGSVLLSWYFFFVRDDPNAGIFVGLWPPTIFAFVSYFKQTRMSDRIDRLTESGGAGIRESVQRMVQGSSRQR